MSPSAASSAPVEPKTVRFQLITPDSPHTTARLPMRVQIYPHDATDSIVTTVKNFYGLYSSPTSSKGVSFEDETGNTMIARYENFRDNMVVYVRVIEEPAMSPSGYASRKYHSPPAASHGSNSGNPYGNGSDGGHGSSNGYYPGPGASSLQHFHHLQEHHGEYISRPDSRTSRKRSLSPNGTGNGNRGRRSDSASTNSKNRSRSSKNRQHSDAYGPDSMAGYSSGDGAPGSSNGRTKEQQPIGNTDISLENIVEGGRRKRAKFESSELPLFAPPQMPAATSNPSVSPARRADHRPSLPYVHPGQNPFSGAGALHSPQHYNTHFGQGGVYATPGSDGRRTRASIGYPGVNSGMGVLPTPDPTVSSMSEEDKDVAMQLMRLGEISNISYGRTSTSTQDDTFSGRADAASSTGATSDSESESEDENSDDYDDVDDDVAPAHRKQRLDLEGASRKIYQSVEPADDDSANADYKEGAQAPGLMAAPKLKKVNNKTNTTNGAPKQARPQATAASKAKPKSSKAKTAANNTMQFPGANSTSAPTTNGGAKSKKANGTTTAVNVPMSPASLPPSRKLSVSSTGGLPPIAAGPGAVAGAGGLGGDEDIADLSSKPRCQRCRKSKKGCDRQRPCGRCRDAGIPAELCISEDEGNGRKGRYGRHMGVPVKNSAGGASSTSMQPPPPPPQQQLQQQPQQVPVSQPHQHQQHQPAHSYVPTAIPSPSHPAPPMHAPIQQQNTLAPQLQQLQQILPPQVPSPPQPAQPMKTLPALLPPAHISSTPIIAPTIPALMAASSEKNKKRKR
ncbi:hypothetical protein Sste5346_007231 [Sporothrix stenoceras]|uniref:Zn(2)-C6 fungal-type domain-containing protein n=1 Tax=Sporothrix stenoceras TaxID=5173 RepID=A0ABR3YW07_9PEZI